MQTKGLFSGKSLLLVLALAAATIQPVSAQATKLTIDVKNAQFTQAAMQCLVDEYHKVMPQFEAVIVKDAQADGTIVLTPLLTDLESSIGRFPVLPVVNSKSALLSDKHLQGGLSDKLKRQLYVESNLEELIADDNDDKQLLPATAYTLCGKNAVIAQVMANSLNVPVSSIKGKKVLGSESSLLRAVTTHADAVSYNVSTLIYDASSGLPVSGITVLPTDLDGNSRIGDDERQAVASVSALTNYLANHPQADIPTGHITLQTKNEALKQFAAWVAANGSQYLANYGLLRTASPLTAQK